MTLSLLNDKQKKFLLDLVFPNKCPVCMRAIRWDKLICDKCFPEMPFIERGTRCLKCGKEHGSEGCTDVHVYDAIVAAMDYTGKARLGMFNFKNRYGLNLGELCVPYIYRALEDGGLLSKIDCITYVPMHKRKEFKRGYNQADRLARYISKATDIPVVDGLLARKETEFRQHDLSASECVKQAEAAYYLGPKTRDEAYNTVLLVDDIVTTGSTLDACAALLKRIGFTTVICAAMCATPLKKETEEDTEK